MVYYVSFDNKSVKQIQFQNSDPKYWHVYSNSKNAPNAINSSSVDPPNSTNTNNNTNSIVELMDDDNPSNSTRCTKFLSCCMMASICSKCRRKSSEMSESPTSRIKSSQKKASMLSRFLPCTSKNSISDSSEQIIRPAFETSMSPREMEANMQMGKKSCWQKFKGVFKSKESEIVENMVEKTKWYQCCNCCRKSSNSNERRSSILSESPSIEKRGLCSRIFCCCCGGNKRKNSQTISNISSMESGKVPDSRRTSVLTNKKKSLTPTTAPIEKLVPKIDESLVEITSQMKGAVPVLPICLAWFCLILNCLLPGIGTILSGILCLCFGIPRFSQYDGAKPRLGSFIINLIVGVSQAFTVIFCLVGWGWAIWWGIIMVKCSRKHRKFKEQEKLNNQNRSSMGGTQSKKTSFEEGPKRQQRHK